MTPLEGFHLNDEVLRWDPVVFAPYGYGGSGVEVLIRDSPMKESVEFTLGVNDKALLRRRSNDDTFSRLTFLSQFMSGILSSPPLMLPIHP